MLPDRCSSVTSLLSKNVAAQQPLSTNAQPSIAVDGGTLQMGHGSRPLPPKQGRHIFLTVAVTLDSCEQRPDCGRAAPREGVGGGRQWQQAGGQQPCSLPQAGRHCGGLKHA